MELQSHSAPDDRPSRHEPAFAILQDIEASDCSRCAERMEGARVDDDLSVLRSRLRAAE